MQPGTATLADIQSRLGQLERQLDAASAALVAGDGDALLRAATSLRDAAAEAARLLPVPTAAVRQGGAELQRRLASAGKRFASCRENLARRSAGVDRAVASLIPAAGADHATYSKTAAGASVGRKFGSRFF
ncbi:hypothetical protein [Xylophilus sp. GOD-11R]|uniref:hypothetical protein n=1 Tax=Xylophilus sp. GOD-11R TaxID=3089814 RepID=UPI00298CED27|nr:hypothetical protein [Xylophilus sp. GOD-11R]WPB57746.1 hypothetical protein R9X41_03590 [Xylophilus sp. GOD-11R]